MASSEKCATISKLIKQLQQITKHVLRFGIRRYVLIKFTIVWSHEIAIFLIDSSRKY